MSVPSSPIGTTSGAESQGPPNEGSSILSDVDASTSNGSTGSRVDTDSSCYKQGRLTGVCQKRKSEASEGKVRKKRYNDHYRELLNETVSRAAGEFSHDEYERFQSGRHGVSWWTAHEKAIMFDVLARKGENDLRTMAAAIGTKSEMEVRVYLQSIRTALERKLRQPRADRLSLTDIPAAAEIGEECCFVLDQHAQSLSSLQLTHEEKVERQKLGELWLLTHDVAQGVEGHLEDEGLKGADIRGRLPAISLLNLPKWLELSERIFMNSASPREDDNWRAIAEGMDTPSIKNTAFSDFHTLTVSVTKRIVQSALFYAKSRLRATDSSRYRYRPLVRAKDVKVAVQVLGMKATTWDYWTGAPRRCNLHIHSGNGKKFRILDYDEVERQLGREEDEEQAANRQTKGLEISLTGHEINHVPVPALAGGSATEGNELKPCRRPSNMSGSNDSSSINDEDEMHTDQELASKQRRSQRQLEHDEDEYAELFDQQIGQAEEERLWEMLGETPTSGVKAEISDLPKRPDIRGKLAPNLIHWRDKIEFWSEWEAFKTPFPHADFGPKMERDGLHDQHGTSEAEAPSRNGSCLETQTDTGEGEGPADGETVGSGRDQTEPKNNLTPEYTSMGRPSDDAQSGSDASVGRSCAGNLVEHKSQLLVDLNREDPSLAPDSDHEDQSSMELDIGPVNHARQNGKEADMSECDGRSVSTSEARIHRRPHPRVIRAINRLSEPNHD